MTAADPARTDETRTALAEQIAERLWDSLPSHGYGRRPWSELREHTRAEYRHMANGLLPLVVGYGNQRAAEALEEAADERDHRGRHLVGMPLQQRLRNRAAALTAATPPSEETR